MPAKHIMFLLHWSRMEYMGSASVLISPYVCAQLNGRMAPHVSMGSYTTICHNNGVATWFSYGTSARI